jgi:hypothetical protein
LNEEDIQKKVLEISIAQWNSTFCGTSGLDICDKLSLSNEIVMAAMEALWKQGRGRINANVELYQIRFDSEIPNVEIPTKPTITHVFFPSRKLLKEHFYSSSLVREKHPEFKNRLHWGGHQLELVMFADEVLTRYFNHPEFYKIDDSLSGGMITTKSGAPENRYLYLRHGKRKLENGRTVVTAILKDLYVMSDEEQRYWHAYELFEKKFDSHDPNFERFVARNFKGEFVDYHNPIKGVVKILENINKSFSEFGLLFKRSDNVYFRVPVENTRKSYYDCCSEFYKIIGPDSLNQKAIKKFLFDIFSVKESELIHLESGRPFSTLQLLSLLEDKMVISRLLSSVIKKIAPERIEADHKVTEPSVEKTNFVDIFIDLCKEYIKAGIKFEERVIQIVIT